jgi:hypothetical protein
MKPQESQSEIDWAKRTVQEEDNNKPPSTIIDWDSMMAHRIYQALPGEPAVTGADGKW